MALGRWALLGTGLLVLVYWLYLWAFTAALDISSDPPGAQVTIDGQRLGRTPFRSKTLVPGVHLVEVQHSHFQRVERRIMLASGGRTKLHVELKPGVGSVLLHTNPRGAWVEVDGRRHDGRTPVILELPSGLRTITVGMDERYTASDQVEVVADERQELLLDLNMDPHGSLHIETVPAGALVSLPGSDIAYSSGVRVPVGEHLVRVSHPGYVTADARFRVRYGDNRYRVELERAYGSLTVTTDPPDARVRVDVRTAAYGPLQRLDYRPDMRLPTGTLEIRATAMGRRSAYRRLELGAAGLKVHLALEVMEAKAGSRFRDALDSGGRGPEMVVVPPGQFAMGDAAGPPSERPVREVTIAEPFAVSVHEVTVGDYRRYAESAGLVLDPALDGREAELPVTHVSFAEAVAYADWLTAQTSRRYRLLSEAEWEYMARAGSAAAYSFGDDPVELCRYANVADETRRRSALGFDLAPCADGYAGLAPVGSFLPNAFDVHDVHGNVAEWVLDCGMPAYEDAPDDGSAVVTGVECPTHGVRGGAWDSGVAEVRTAKRNLASSANGSRGIRLLREL